MMKVILQEDVTGLGVVGDLVAVRDGYGRNFLIPEGKAVFASVRSVNELEHQKRLASHRRKQATAGAEISRRKIESLSIVMQAKVAAPHVTDEGHAVVEKLQKLYGSVTTRDLSHVLQGSDVKVDHRKITFNDQVRTVGKYMATVKLDGGVSATLPFWVIPEGAADVESEKKRVEAAQETHRKEREAAIVAEKIAAVAAEKERLRLIEARRLQAEADALAPTPPEDDGF